VTVTAAATTETAPVVYLSCTPLSGTAPLTVTCTDGSSNKPTAWRWTFGDGGTSTAQDPRHTYTAAETYTVTLTASNSAGSGSKTQAGYIIVTAATKVVAPVAAFSCTPLSGTAPLTVTCTDGSSNKPTAWRWTFGDGGTSTAQDPSHSYTEAGTYTVTLTASNSAGSGNKTQTGYVVVSADGHHRAERESWRSADSGR
jgi:PKD repeat protein